MVNDKEPARPAWGPRRWTPPRRGRRPEHNIHMYVCVYIYIYIFFFVYMS